MDGWMEALGGRREERRRRGKKSHVTGKSRRFSGSHEMALADARATPCVALCTDVLACVWASR